MILIADAGASKTDWRLIDGEQITQFKCGGYNLVTHSLPEYIDSIGQVFQSYGDAIEKLYFYGAGITSGAVAESLSVSFRTVFPRATSAFSSDLLGAARSLFGKEKGMVGILGTGSAGCLYSGEKIERRVPSLGYVIGDEGSGADLGKRLVKLYLRGRLPATLERKLARSFQSLSEESVLEKIYHAPGANKYLASFGSFVIEHQGDPFVYQIIHESFYTYFDSFYGNTNDYKDIKFRFTGSVAYLLSNILRKVSMERGIQLDIISQSPISGLSLYHQKYG